MWVFPPELPLKCEYEFYLRRASAARGVDGRWVPGVSGGWVHCLSLPSVQDLQTAGAKCPAPG